MSIIIYGITFLIVGIVIFIVNKFDKSKTTEQVIKTFQDEPKK